MGSECSKEREISQLWTCSGVQSWKGAIPEIARLVADSRRGDLCHALYIYLHCKMCEWKGEVLIYECKILKSPIEIHSC